MNRRPTACLEVSESAPRSLWTAAARRRFAGLADLPASQRRAAPRAASPKPAAGFSSAPFVTFDGDKSSANCGAESAEKRENLSAAGRCFRPSCPLLTIAGVLAILLAIRLAGAGELLDPPALWKDFDPNKGDFKEEIIRQKTTKGIFYRESYISAYVLNQEIRVYCKYSVRAGVSNVPGLLDVHGWTGTANIARDFVDDGWAVMAHDYCGRYDNRPHFTKYPESLRHGNMEPKAGPPIHDTKPDGESITDPKQSSDYLWYAIERRVLSYLERQQEVDKSRLGARGYSYGGTLLWPLGTDPRVKAIVAYFGIGWIQYYRNKAVWLYNNPYVEPEKSPGEEIFLAALAPEAYVPHIRAATLYLNGSNDHHGGFERGLESFKRFQPGVPWAFAVQARGHHNTEQIEQDCKLWLDKYVRGREVFWPEHPKSHIALDAAGVPELRVTPASPERVKKVEIYYALKSPCSFARAWRDATFVRRKNTWIANLPVMHVDDYVFAYANITYDTTVVLSTDFNAAIPAKLGRAKATDRRSDVISHGTEEISAWSNVAEVEGPGGLKGFRSTDNRTGSFTEKLNDPKYQAPPKSSLEFKFFCTEPQTLIFGADHYNEVEIEIGGADTWQTMVIEPRKLINRFSQQPMKNWSDVGRIHFVPKAGSDLTKVIFAEFRWISLPPN